MILGIDLATVNCGLCFMQDDEQCRFATIGLGKKNINSDEAVINFTNALSKLVSDQICYVDFSFNECFFNNQKKHVSVKYFLAAVIYCNAKETYFIKPSQVREHFGFAPKMNKYKFHEQMFLDHLKQENEHERDAYLLALMGLQLQRNKQ